jgi:hypothetical protein
MRASEVRWKHLRSLREKSCPKRVTGFDRVTAEEPRDGFGADCHKAPNSGPYGGAVGVGTSAPGVDVRQSFSGPATDCVWIVCLRG